MVNQQTLEGKWNQVRGKIQEKWGQLTDDDLRSFSGNVDQLVGRIQQRTGESRDSIERYLNQLVGEGTMGDVRNRLSQSTSQVAESMRQSYHGAERYVQQRPGQTLAISFGIGMLAGVGIAMMLMREPQGRITLHRGYRSRQKFGQQVLEGLAALVPESVAKSMRN